MPPAEQERKYHRPGDPELDGDLESDLGSIVIVYRAKLDEGNNKVVTPINLTQVRLLLGFCESVLTEECLLVALGL